MKTALIAGLLACCAGAQTPSEPPLLLKLIQTPGAASGAIRPYIEARAALNVFGMTALTGVPETWLIEAHNLFASIEDLDRAMISAPPARTQEELLAPPRTLIALYRPGWSYRPDQAVKWLSVARYCHITIYRIRPGGEADFRELTALRRWRMDSLNVDRPDMAYQVVSGAPSGTFVFIAPLASLRTFDEGLMRIPPVHAEAALEAGAKAVLKIAAEAEISREHLLFRIDPWRSYVSDEFASADPQFWRPKATPR